MNNEEKFVVPTTQFTENAAGYELKVELPGVGKEDAELHIEGKTLVLKTHATHQNPAGFRAVVSEFARSNFAMTADLPELADSSALSARLENGLLTVTIPKRPETQPRKIAIV